MPPGADLKVQVLNGEQLFTNSYLADRPGCCEVRFVLCSEPLPGNYDSHAQALAKAEKARLRSLKKQQKDEIEKLREKQNASIAKVRSSNPQISDARAGVLPRKRPFPAPPRRGEAGTSRSFPAPAIAIDAAGFG